MTVNPIVVDLSHWDPAYDYGAVSDAGIVGVIFKATEGSSYTDSTYVSQQQAAKKKGLSWGAYHFADSSSVTKQIDNFMKFACPDPDELFCLDWEDNGGNVMSLSDAKTWITEVENQLDREGQCVLYSGNTAKETLGDNVNTFMGARRLWLCQYSTTPTWQKSWDKPWLWQFTDGNYGPTPHEIDGIGACDINSYNGTSDQLIADWASGGLVPPAPTPTPDSSVVTILIDAPPNVTVKIRQSSLTITSRKVHRAKEAGAHRR